MKIPGRYDFPDLDVEACINNEVRVHAGELFETYFNVCDLLEVVLRAAWEIDPEGVTEILRYGVLHIAAD